MSKFTEYIGSQFGNPRGMIGKICCVLMNIINRRMYARTVSMIRLPQHSSILDIGYGNGHLLKLLDKSGKKYELYGIDISEDMRQQAVRKNRRALADGRLHLEVGDCCDLSYEDGTFHAITSINTVYFWADTRRGMSEIHRCLADNGVFYNVVYTKEWLDTLSYTEKGFKKFEPQALIDIGHEAGFADVTVQDIVKGKSFAVICRKG